MDQLVHINQLIAHVLSFIVFFFLVRGAFISIIYPPMKERRDRIRTEYERIEQEKASVADLRRQYENHLKQIEAESRERIQSAVAEGQHVATEIREIALATLEDERTCRRSIAPSCSTRCSCSATRRSSLPT